MLIKSRLAKWLFLSLAVVLTTVVLAGLFTSAYAEMVGDEAKVLARFNGQDKSPATGIYIIKLSDPPLALYRGGVRNLAPTSTAGARKLDVKSRTSVAYRQYLAAKREAVNLDMAKKLSRSVPDLFHYEVVFNGMAVKLSLAEAEKVRQLSGVLSVKPEKVSYLLTDAGPRWIGAEKLWDDVSFPVMGEGMVVGIIDSGINPHNPSFADIGDDGYNHTNPRGIYYGVCNPLSPDYDAGFCNDKLIGAYDMTPEGGGNPKTALDVHGHGSHTASTVAGNVLSAVQVIAPTLSTERAISGVAPHSNIIAYRVCYPANVYGGDCSGSAIIAAVEQSVIDQVDVVNYSIGGGSSNPWDDNESLAFLAAREAGVMVATSAGNSGPYAGTVGSPGDAPWIMAVGAATHNRAFQNRLGSFADNDGAKMLSFTGQSFTSGYAQADIVYAGAPPYNDAQAKGPFAPGTFNGEIVVCDWGGVGRVAKGENLLAGGAGAMVLVNNSIEGDFLITDMHVLPAIHLNYTDGVALKNWIASSSSPKAAICGTTLTAGEGDLMAFFSSRGPDVSVPDVVKPDLAAPGVSILAAGGSDISKPYGVVEWEIMSGTSMASPHAAGAATLLRQLEPGWSPAEIQSALMTTAVTDNLFLDDGQTPADPFVRGAGRISLPDASAAGLVLEVTPAEYRAADPAQGGQPASLNLPSFAANQAIVRKTWQRTVKSVLPTAETWGVTFSNPAGVSLTVSPSSFTLQPGAVQTITLAADVGAAELKTWLFGELQLTPASPAVPVARLPIALRCVNSNIERSLIIENAENMGVEKIEDLEAIAITDLFPRYYGLTAAQVYEEKIIQNPQPGSLYTDPDPLTDGNFQIIKQVPAGCQRLVAEIVSSTAPDLDLFVYYRTGGRFVAISTNQGSQEKCSLVNPDPGEYWIYVDCYAASDPDGVETDDLSLAVALVPDSSGSNLAAEISGGATSMPAKKPFGLDVSWDLSVYSNPGNYWYGAFDLGSSSADPGNLGTVTIDLYRCSNGHIRLMASGVIYSESLQEIYDNRVIDGDTLQLHTGSFAETLDFNREIDLCLSGGYSCDYSEVKGVSTVKGSLTVSAGTVVVQNLVLTVEN